MGLWRKNKSVTVPDTAKPAEAVRQALVRFDEMSVTAPLLKQEGPGGVNLGYDLGCLPIWAKLSGGGPTYSWTEMKRLPNGTWQTGSRTGTTATEVNNVTGLNGTIQQLVPDCNGSGGMHFQSIRKGGGPAKNCVTIVKGVLADVNGVTGPNAVFCPAPGKINYVVSGFENQAGAFIPAYDSTNGYTFTISFNNIPSGTYSLHMYSDKDLCGDTRFDKTFSIKSGCPDISITNGPNGYVLPAKYDILNTGSTWYIAGCTSYSLSERIATPNVDIAVSCSGTVCQSQYYHDQPGAGAGSIQVTCKVPSYPFTITFSASAPNCIGESQTLTYNSCHDITDDWCGNYPQVCWTLWPCAAWVCHTCDGIGYYGLPGAFISVSGGYTGTGITTDAGVHTDIVTITSWVPPKCGVTKDQLVTNWTVTHPRTVGASYSTTDPETTDPYHVVYGYDMRGFGFQGGMFCPVGGYAGAPADGYSCGNCPKPLSRTLSCTILGTEVTLVKSAAEGNPYGAWVGYGNWQTTCNPCKPAQGCPGIIENGSVPFQVIWGGRACYVGQSSSTPAVYFSTAMGFGIVCECPVNPYHPDGSYAWAMGCGYYSPYRNGETMICDPLLSSGGCQVTVGVQGFCPDGTCAGYCHNYTATLSWTITE